MELVFGFKGENGKVETKTDYSFDADTIEKIKKDFETYLSGITPARGAVKGGCYPCTRGKTTGIYLCLKFDEIVYMG